jgi:hypothetical protein
MPVMDLVTYRDQIFYTIVAFVFLYTIITYMVIPHISSKQKMLQKLEEQYLLTPRKYPDVFSTFIKLLFKNKLIK